MIEERRKYKSLNSTERQKKYRALSDLVIRKSREAKERCSEIETLIKTGSGDETYNMVKKFFGQYKPKVERGEGNNEQMLCEQKDEPKYGRNI